MEPSGRAINPLTAFVGRKRELRDVKAAVKAGRLVTLTGAGGSGKTRLALRAAAGLAADFASGVVVVELAPLSEARLVAQAVAAALDLPEEPGRPLAATISDHIRSQALLIVLDNCEHLVAEVAALADALLRSCGDLHILATSRIRLGIAGEQVWSVPELIEAESIALFAERAVEAQPSFVLGKDNRAPVREICLRLDGMPLAIELAAARLRILSLDELRARLDDRFRLLTGGSRTALPRHQSLEATTDWSHALLPAAAQCLWHRLSIFAGGFALDAAEAVGEGGPVDRREVLSLLSGLVDASLVRVSEPNGRLRYSMLETIREYGRRKLDQAGDTGGTQRRHLAWFLDLARRAEPEWRGAHQVEWLSRLDADLDNVRVALETSREDADLVDSGLSLVSALWLLWHSRGHMAEGREWLASLLERASPNGVKANALNVAGFMAYVQGDTQAAVPLLEASLALQQRLGHAAGVSFSMLRLGIGLYYDNQLDRAIAVLDDALSRYRVVKDRVGIYISGYELAEALSMRGDYERSRTLHEESLALKRQQGDIFHLGLAHFGLGILAWRTADLPEAARHLRESMAYSKQIEEGWGITRSIEALSWVEADRGNLQRAVHLMGAADSLLHRTSSRLSANYAVHHGAVLNRLRNSLAAAAFEAAWSRGQYLDSDQALAFALATGSVPSIKNPTPGGVSRREEQIARLVADGLTNRQIAGQLSLSERTVDAHLEHIMNKLGYRSRAQVAAWVTAQRD